ncbi:ferric reductase-like transmembrane domain-containing protein [Aestuariivita boseongensis]|uniref:ferric reductase-like transmembrane domain-containing protein n=1 Tax=Aestuariivita boseongensis TaxID=1470562 RepID=UPI000681C78E|nr:ferric reductase-like transmembrane domain-containing protein [Aestuariivita boseongensis]
MRAVLIWGALGAALLVPLWVAATSPLLAWREPIYIIAGLAGVIGLALMALQPLLAAGLLPGLPAPKGRRVHLWIGLAIVTAVILHVAGLWITSPPDVIDALTFRSPTPFAIWGVMAMWAVFAAALLASLRRKLRLPPRIWRRAHTALALVIVGGTSAHALLIEGTMGTVSKTALCLLVVLATLKVIHDLRIWTRRRA